MGIMKYLLQIRSHIIFICTVQTVFSFICGICHKGQVINESHTDERVCMHDVTGGDLLKLVLFSYSLKTYFIKISDERIKTSDTFFQEL